MNLIELKQIENLYDVFIIDIWGVVYDGKNPYKEAIDAVNRLINNGKEVIFLSNNPRPSYIATQKLSSFGIDMNKASIYTSGDAVREQLKNWNDEIFINLGKNLYHFGAKVNQDILRDLDVNLTDNIEKADFVLITMYVDSREEITAYDEIMQKAISLNLPAICANPDITAQEGNLTRYTAGTFAKKYEELGGTAYYYGKPHKNVFDTVLALFGNEKKAIMIGDTMETDILGANRAGIDSLLVLTGNGQCYSTVNYDYHPSLITERLD